MAEKGHTVDLNVALYVGLEVPSAFVVQRAAEMGWYEPVAEQFYADQIKRIADAGP